MFIKKLSIIAVFAFAVTAVSQTPVACSNLTVGTNGSLNGFIPSPNDAWHQDITSAPIDPASAKITTSTTDLGGSSLHPDFSSIAAGSSGIPYTVVDSTNTPNIAVPIVLYGSESDITLYPVPAVLPVELNPGECPTDTQDRHAIIIDRNQCVAYEFYQAAHCTSGWTASGAAIWDFTTTEKRPYTYTSADAAGLSVFEGLIRYDEIVAGSINHAIRFTARHTKSDAHIGYFTAPATHAAGNLSSADNIMGMRIRLKASFDISGYSSTNQIILKAMKQYGMILADNGSNLFFQGTPDARWNDSDLSALKKVPASAFDVIQMGPVYESNTAPKGAVPVISSFTASSNTVAAGTSVTLTPTVTGASYSYIDKVGFIRGAVTVTPTATTTYTLTSRNQFGTVSASTTVTVQGQATPTLVFTSIPAQTYGTAAFAVSATSASTGAVTYSVVSGPATVSGSSVSITGIGTVVLQASQAAAGTYSAATATTSFTVAAASPGLTFVAVAGQVYGAAPLTVSSTTSSAGSILYSVVSGPATISGNTVTLTGAGTVALQATQAAAGNYTAGTATTSFTVGTAQPGLAFVGVPSEVFGTAPFAVSTTSSSTGTITYSVVSGPATVSGNTVTLTAVGTVVLQASQAAAGNYSAGTATTSFAVTAPVAMGLTVAPIPAKTYGDAPFTVTATSSSPGAITYSVWSGHATISGQTVTITGIGTVTIMVKQAASGTYPAASMTATFTVAPGPPPLAFVPIPDQVYVPGASFKVNVTTPSFGALTYTIVSGPASIVFGHTLTPSGTGTVVVQVNLAASGNYTAGTSTTSFNLTSAP